MKIRVLRRFKDKHTKEIHEVNTVLDVTKKRAAEIVKNLGEGFVAEEPESGEADGDS